MTFHHTRETKVWNGVEAVEPHHHHHTLLWGVGCGVEAWAFAPVVWNRGEPK